MLLLVNLATILWATTGVVVVICMVIMFLRKDRKIRELQKKDDEHKNRLKNVTYIDKDISNILVLGIRAVGKTTLMNEMKCQLGDPLNTPPTLDVEYHTLRLGKKEEVRTKEEQKTKWEIRKSLQFLDFSGERRHRAIREFCANNDVAGLIMVVSLYRGKDNPTHNPICEPDHVRENIAFFNIDILQVLLGNRDNLKKVILFINKIDLMECDPNIINVEAENVYQEIVNCIRLIVENECNDNFFECITGSASDGRGVSPLKRSLIEAYARGYDHR